MRQASMTLSLVYKRVLRWGEFRNNVSVSSGTAVAGDTLAPLISLLQRDTCLDLDTIMQNEDEDFLAQMYDMFSPYRVKRGI